MNEPIPTVSDEAGPAPSAADEAVGLGKSVVVGSVIGVILSFLAVLLFVGFAGYGWGAAVGLGLFIAFWGGLGFGVMVGGVTYLSSLEDH